MDASSPPPPPPPSSSTTIVVPRHMELLSLDAASPAVVATASATDAPSVSPVAHDHAHHTTADSSHDKLKTTKTQAGMNGGRWTEQEHQSFLAGLRLYGREWKKVASKIKTRTSAQIRSHAQKYFAKLARDDDTRRQVGGGPDDASGLHAGYMSDDGSASTLSGDDGGDTDASPRQLPQPTPPFQPTASLPRSIALMPVHPFPSPTLQSAPSSSYSASTLVPIKKRARPTPAAAAADGAAPTPTAAAFKQRRTADVMTRLPSPEELVETVSPTVRQRLSSLIDAEICALQVLSCYTWAQQQQQQQQQQSDLMVHVSPHRLSPATSANGPMKLAMLAAERIF